VQYAHLALTVDVKTLTGPLEWHVTDFGARPGHFLTFVWYASATDPTRPPRVFIVASEQLREFVAHHGEERISLERLDEEIPAREAWQRLAISPVA
jgi:hypothetical protein